MADRSRDAATTSIGAATNVTAATGHASVTAFITAACNRSTDRFAAIVSLILAGYRRAGAIAMALLAPSSFFT